MDRVCFICDETEDLQLLDVGCAYDGRYVCRACLAAAIVQYATTHRYYEYADWTWGGDDDDE